jgi:hypothetical protein
MNVNALAKDILQEMQEHLGSGKKSNAQAALVRRLTSLLEPSPETEEVVLQVDLDCGVYKGAWINRPDMTTIRVVIAESPTVGDDDGDGVYIDDDRVIIAVVSPELMPDTVNVLSAMEDFEG